MVDNNQIYLNLNNQQIHKRSLGHKQKSEVTRKFEEAIARSQEIEDVTLESHNELIDDLPQIVANHQSLLDLSTNMNYDRDEYAKQLINLIDSQQQYLTDLRNKALQMREAVAYEDLCAKGIIIKMIRSREKQHASSFFIPPVFLFFFSVIAFPPLSVYVCISLIRFTMYKKVFIAFMHFYFINSASQSIMTLLLFIGTYNILAILKDYFFKHIIPKIEILNTNRF